MITEQFTRAYNQLNKEQKTAVDTIEGPVMVVAGPGTGKTTLLTVRIANILAKTDANPENILALTFTNSGVFTMRKKLVELIGDAGYRVNIFTFHSFAENVMKEFSFYFKDLESFHVVDDLGKIKILEEILSQNNFKELGSAFDPLSALQTVREGLDRIKKEGLTPEQFELMIPMWEQELRADESIYYKKKYGAFQAGDIKPTEEAKIKAKIAKAREMVTVCLEYQKQMHEKGLYDFSDMIINVLTELERNENLKLDLQEKYQYVLVDEHQDTNDGQNKLIELLTDAEHLEGKPNLFTVGDEKQSIYRFQGASEKTFRHFNELYNDIVHINLENNYRSTKHILDASHQVITQSVPGATALKSHRDDNEPIALVEFSNYKFEILYLAKDIQERIQQGIDPRDIAVIYRSNKHVIDIRNVFNQYGIPHTIFSKDNLLEDINIGNLITLLRVVHNPRDNHALGKALFVDFLGFNAYRIIEVLDEFHRAARAGKSQYLFELLQTKDELKNFTEIITKLTTLSANNNFLTFFKKFIEEIGYMQAMLSAPDSRDRLVLLDKIFDEIKRQSQSVKGYALGDFLSFIDTALRYNLDIEVHHPEIIEGVKLMTAHRSKGLEFPYVYMVNTTSRNWEKSRGGPKMSLPVYDYQGSIDDERRLFYVALTRAQKGLCISSSLTDWEGKEQEKSRFVDELGEEHVHIVDARSFEKENIDRMAIFMQDAQQSSDVWDTDYLKELFLGKNLSVTALNNYVACPIKYLLRNLIQLPSEYTPSLLFGNLVHEALEKFFQQSAREEKLCDRKVLLGYYRSAIDASRLFGDDYKRFLAKGETLLGEYYDEYAQGWIIDIQTEESIKRSFVLPNGETLRLSGIVDKIEYIDDTRTRINIIDYKTGKPFSEKKQKSQKEDLRRQIIFYHILMEDYHGGEVRVQDAVLDFLEKNKKGLYERHSIEVSSEDIETVKDEIIAMAENVMSGEFLNKGCRAKDCEHCQLFQTIKGNTV